MLLCFSIFTGATFNLAKYVVAYFSATSAAAWRFGLAALVMLMILVFRDKIQLKQLKQNALTYGILGIVGIFGFNTLFFWGLKSTSPVNGALIMATNPLLTVLFSRMILKEGITRRQASGVILSFIGVVLVLTHGSLNTITSLSFSHGDLLILIGNACWAFYGVFSRRFIKSGSSFTTTTYTMVVGAICLITLALFNPNPVHLHAIPQGAWGAIGFMAFFTSVLGYLFWNKGISEIGASQTSIFFNLVPVVTMLISLTIGVGVTLLQMNGAILVITGVLLASGIRLKRSNSVFLNDHI